MSATLEVEYELWSTSKLILLAYHKRIFTTLKLLYPWHFFFAIVPSICSAESFEGSFELAIILKLSCSSTNVAYAKIYKAHALPPFIYESRNYKAHSHSILLKMYLWCRILPRFLKIFSVHLAFIVASCTTPQINSIGKLLSESSICSPVSLYHASWTFFIQRFFRRKRDELRFCHIGW